MASNTPTRICLDIAVDHRIRRLFKPVRDDPTECSNHVSHIEARGWSLKRSCSEIQVTRQLAGPSVKGGIAVALQQPRQHHPFEKGLGAVIENSGTLYALDSIFCAVSCGSLNIQTNITVVDLLPYMWEDIASIDDETLRESFRASRHMILDKEPSVLLCAGKIRLPNNRKDVRNLDSLKLESIGVGKRFGDTPKLPVKVKIRHGEKGFVTISKINGFHPSYAMNYHPHVSILRQLQILIGVETCAMLRREDWEEERWIVELRRRCREISRAWSESPSQYPRPQSPGGSATRRNGAKHLPQYQELYSEKLDGIHNWVQSLISESLPAIKSSTALYVPLLTSGLSEICNDATLILRQMLRLQRIGWLNSVAWKNRLALKKATRDTLRFTQNLLKATEPGKDSQFAKIIQEGANYLLKSIPSGSDSRPYSDLDLKRACDGFLKIATNIETLLLDLLLKEEKALSILGQEEMLSKEMERMRLVSVTH